MKLILWILKYFLYGALSFWLSDLIINLIIRRISESIWIIALLLCSPSVTIYFFILLKKKNMLGPMIKVAPFVMVLGIWLLAPLFIALSQLPYGGSFFDAEFFNLWITGPFATTFIMSTYSGSLGGVLLVSICLIAIGIWNLNLRNILTKD